MFHGPFRSSGLLSTANVSGCFCRELAPVMRSSSCLVAPLPFFHPPLPLSLLLGVVLIGWGEKELFLVPAFQGDLSTLIEVLGVVECF